MTSVPRASFGPNGFTSPAESELVAGAFADLNAAFGGGLNPDPTTPQGQLAISLGAIIGASNDVFAAMANGFDPAYADGRQQDALGRIYFLERNPAEPTTVDALCSGAQGTVIPTGALAKAADGNTYVCTSGGTIDATGAISLPFACTVTGPIVCAAGSLTTIYRVIPGWDSITNPADGVLGRVVEGRADFEQRRSDSVALNALGTLGSIKALVGNVTNVLDVYVTDNPENAAVVIGGVNLNANSLFVSVVGGADLDVATAIWKKKMPGCGYTGNTTVAVTDPNPGYNPPAPVYQVTFCRPAALTVKFAVVIANAPNVPSNAAELVQNAIITAFAGADGGRRARIGSTVFASRFYPGVAALGDWAQNIVSILIGSDNDDGTATHDKVTAHIDQAPVTSAADITVTLQ